MGTHGIGYSKRRGLCDGRPHLLAPHAGALSTHWGCRPKGTTRHITGCCRQLLSLKQRSGEFRLPNDAQQGTAWRVIVKRNRNCYRGRLQTLLHDPMAASLADCDESVFSRIRQISDPERTRSLPNRNLNLRHENFVAGAPGDFGRGGSFEEQRKRLDEVSSRFFNGGTVARDVKLRAQRHKNVVLTLDNRG